MPLATKHTALVFLSVLALTLGLFAPLPARPQDDPGKGPPVPPTPSAPQATPSPSNPGLAPSPAPPGKRTFKMPAPPQNFSPPTIEIQQPDFDWGTAVQGEVIRHSFTVENKGGAPLTITQVKPSCGCTTAAKPEKPIEPGAKGLITLEVDTKKFSGQIKKTAEVISNAGPVPAKLSMGGKVDALFSIEPAAPKIDLVRGVPVEPVKLVLKRTSKLPLKIKELKTEQKVLKAELKEVTPGEAYDIFVTADVGDKQSKYLNEAITLKLDNEGKDFEVPISVSVSVKDRIDVQPRSSVYFSRSETKPLTATPGGTPISKVLDIKSLGTPDHNFKVTGVAFESQTPNFETKLETVTEGKAYRLTVTMSKLPADTKSRTVRDVILVQTDDPTAKELKITALAAVQ